MKRHEFVSVVMYFERGAQLDRCVALVGLMAGFLREGFSVAEIVVVDDTGEGLVRVLDLEALACPIRVVELAHHHGPEAGMVAGLERAVGDWVFEIEGSTGGFTSIELWEMFEKALEGRDIVALVPSAPPRSSRLFYWLVNRYSNLGRDLTSERVRLVSRRALNALMALGERVRHRKALYALTGLPFAAVSYQAEVSLPRRRLNRENSGLAFDVLLATSNFGVKVAHVLSLTFLLFSVGAGIYALVINFVKHDVIEGWTTLMIVVAVGFAGLFLVLAVLGEYMARILAEVRRRPLYAAARDVQHIPAGGELIPGAQMQSGRPSGASMAESDLPEEHIAAGQGSIEL
jgi:dolichol-phosphate mannosyltransferase